MATLSTAMNGLLNERTRAMRELRRVCVDCLQAWGVELSGAVTAVGVLYQPQQRAAG